MLRGVKSAEGRNRTGDTMIFSHVLYQLSYLGTRRYSSRPSPRVTIPARKGPYHAVCVDYPLRAAGAPSRMMTSTGGSSSHQELTSELAALDRQLRDLSEQWETVERTITEKTRLRRELIAQQEATNVDNGEEINRLQSDVYALRDKLDQLRDSHLDFSALYRILQQART
jgi:prefoldin subunit 5